MSVGFLGDFAKKELRKEFIRSDGPTFRMEQHSCQQTDLREISY